MFRHTGKKRDGQSEVSWW